MTTQKTKVWREKNKDSIQLWRKKMDELIARSYGENWSHERYEMEVMQHIENQKMREVFLFAKNYIARYKTGKFRSLMAETYQEIIDYGVIEPSRLNFLKKTGKVILDFHHGVIEVLQ